MVKRMKWIPFVTAVPLVLLAACGQAEPTGNLDQSAQTACDDLAGYLADGAPEDLQETLAAIAELAQESDVESIATAGENLANVTIEGWEPAAEQLSAACESEGWQVG